MKLLIKVNSMKEVCDCCKTGFSKLITKTTNYRQSEESVMIVVRSSIKSIKLIATLQGQDSHYIHYQPTGSILTKSAQSDTNLLQESTIKILSNHYRFICMPLVSYYFVTLLVDALRVPKKKWLTTEWEKYKIYIIL